MIGGAENCDYSSSADSLDCCELETRRKSKELTGRNSEMLTSRYHSWSVQVARRGVRGV